MIRQVLFFAPSVVWLLLYAWSVFFQVEIEDRLWFLAGLWWLAVYAMGLGILITYAVRSTRGRGRVASALAILFPVAVLLWTECGGAMKVQDARRHWVIQHQYEPMLVEIRAGAREQWSQEERRLCHVEGVRVAFQQPGGLLDNWTAIVYDPTGLVMDINRCKSYDEWRSPKMAHVRGLFGGDLQSAQHLEGFWYLCSFT
jgi:hypothetical protein